MLSYICKMEIVASYDAPDYFLGHGSGDFADHYTGSGDTIAEAARYALFDARQNYIVTDQAEADIIKRAQAQDLNNADGMDGYQWFVTVRIDPAPEVMPVHFVACTASSHCDGAIFELADGSTMLAQGDDAAATLADCWPPYADADDVQGIPDDYLPYFEPPLVTWISSGGRVCLDIPLDKALAASEPGSNDAAIEELLQNGAIAIQLSLCEPDDIRRELQDKGAWTEEELQDDAANRRRLLWIACDDIRKEA